MELNVKSANGIIQCWSKEFTNKLVIVFLSLSLLSILIDVFWWVGRFGFYPEVLSLYSLEIVMFSLGIGLLSFKNKKANLVGWVLLTLFYLYVLFNPTIRPDNGYPMGYILVALKSFSVADQMGFLVYTLLSITPLAVILTAIFAAIPYESEKLNKVFGITFIVLMLLTANLLFDTSFAYKFITRMGIGDLLLTLVVNSLFYLGTLFVWIKFCKKK